MTEEEIQQLQTDKIALEAQVAQLQADALVQGDRLTTALIDLEEMTADRNRYQTANAALQRAIHAATASVPEMSELTVQALSQIEATLIQGIQTSVAGLIAQIRAGG